MRFISLDLGGNGSDLASRMRKGYIVRLSRSIELSNEKYARLVIVLCFLSLSITLYWLVSVSFVLPPTDVARVYQARFYLFFTHLGELRSRGQSRDSELQFYFYDDRASLGNVSNRRNQFYQFYLAVRCFISYVWRCRRNNHDNAISRRVKALSLAASRMRNTSLASDAGTGTGPFPRRASPNSS